MNVKDFGSWKSAVSSECSKLNEVRDYLNDKGLERYQAFRLLENLASFCSTASELDVWVQTKEQLEPDEIKLLGSGQIMLPLIKLSRLAKAEQPS